MRARAEVGEPEISILLLARDGAATLPALLDAVEAQRAARAFEVVAVDSGSTDGSLDLLRQRADRLLTVPSSEFNHGTTRNTGIAACRGRFIVLLVQDAVPASPDWLSLLVEPLLSDDSLAGTFARQWPRPGASALTRHYHAAALAARAEPRVLALDGEQEFAVLPPVERYQRCAFDNVCSCIRRSVWEAHPFA